MKSQSAIKEHLREEITSLWFPYAKRITFLTSCQVVNVQISLDYYVDYRLIKQTQDLFRELNLEVVLTKLTTTENTKTKRTIVRIESRPVGFTAGMNRSFSCYEAREEYFKNIELTE